MTIDADAAALLDRLAAMGNRPLEELPVDEGRQMAGMLALFDGDPEPVDDVVDRIVEHDGAAIPVRLYRATAGSDAQPILVWFHAGGGVIGDLETADRTCPRLATRT